MDKINQKMKLNTPLWLTILLGAAQIILIVFLPMGFTNAREDKKDIKQEIAKKVDKTEFDNSNTEVRKYIDKQDGLIITVIDEHKKADKETKDALTGYMQSLDRKIDILLSRK